jgi:hypothetical protein
LQEKEHGTPDASECAEFPLMDVLEWHEVISIVARDPRATGNLDAAFERPAPLVSINLEFPDRIQTGYTIGSFYKV